MHDCRLLPPSSPESQGTTALTMGRMKASGICPSPSKSVSLVRHSRPTTTRKEALTCVGVGKGTCTENNGMRTRRSPTASP